MTAECYPISMLPGASALFRDFCEGPPEAVAAEFARWYGARPFARAWVGAAPVAGEEQRERLAAALREHAEQFGADEASRAAIERLRAGAAAVVTGQQVGLFGGPLLTLLKAATALRQAQEASAASGRDHVAVFWLASEDHDLPEVDQVTLLTRNEPEALTLGLQPRVALPVGALRLDGAGTLEATLEHASDLLGWGPAVEALRACYAAGETLASGFGRWLAKVFAGTGLIVMDAAGRSFHALGADVLRAGVEQADVLETALLERSAELERAGYHAQVMVTPGHSLLFLVDDETGARQPLRRTAEGAWKAGQRTFSPAELLAILDEAPERLSPNALLRPVFQDSILPTAAYVGGPAEVAYFAQSAAVYERILGRVTPILPRLSATLVEPAIASLLAKHEVTVPQVWEAKNADALTLRLGARAMPVEAKKKLAAAGNAMDEELTALTGYMRGLSEDLGRAADVSASKMRYQMDRLRRMAAQFETQKEASLRKHANAIMLSLFPEGELQERVLAGAWFVARDGGGLIDVLVAHAGLECPGHRVLML